MSMCAAVLKEFDQEAGTTRRVLERVPTDKLAWKPHPKSMSLGQLALHVATVPGNVAELAARDIIPEPPSFVQPEAATASELGTATASPEERLVSEIMTGRHGPCGGQSPGCLRPGSIQDSTRARRRPSSSIWPRSGCCFPG